VVRCISTRKIVQTSASISFAALLCAHIRRSNLPDKLEAQRGKQLNTEVARCQLTIDRLEQEKMDISMEMRRSQTAEWRLESENAKLKAELLKLKSQHC